MRTARAAVKVTLIGLGAATATVIGAGFALRVAQQRQNRKYRREMGGADVSTAFAIARNVFAVIGAAVVVALPVGFTILQITSQIKTEVFRLPPPREVEDVKPL